jgi:Tol biopolymer transport system component
MISSFTMRWLEFGGVLLLSSFACGGGGSSDGSSGGTGTATEGSSGPSGGGTMASDTTVADGTAGSASDPDATADDTGPGECAGAGPWPATTTPWPASRTPDGAPLHSGASPSLSGDGRLVAYLANLDPATGTGTDFLLHVYLYDAACDTTTRIPFVPENEATEEVEPAVSADGSTVVFSTRGQPIVENMFTTDVFAYDVEAGTIEPISVRPAGELARAQSLQPSVSADGRFVAFWSSEPLGDGVEEGGVFLRDRERGTTEWVGSGERPAISGDGNVVAFAFGDVFAWDRTTGTTETVSLTMEGMPSNVSNQPAISADGRFVAFASLSSGIVAGDTNAEQDVFVHDRETGTTERVSLDGDGNELLEEAYAPKLSGDGRWVLMSIGSISVGTGSSAQVWIRDRETGSLTRVSQNSAGEVADRQAWVSALSSDGAFVAFETQASNLAEPPERFFDYDAYVVARP